MAETAAKAKNARGHPKKVQDPLLMAKKPAKRGRPKKVEWPTVSKNEAFVPATSSTAKMADKKNSFETKFGEGTAFDLDYGKLLIIALCVYIAVQVS